MRAVADAARAAGDEEQESLVERRIRDRRDRVDARRGDRHRWQAGARVGLEPEQVLLERDVTATDLELRPPVDRSPVVDRQERALGVREQRMALRPDLAGGQPVLERRVGVEQARRLGVVGLQEALDVDGGDERPLLVDDGLALDDARR